MANNKKTDPWAGSNTINIGAHLEAAQPYLAISNKERYEIDDDKNVVMKAHELLTRDGEQGEDDLDQMNELLKLVLGEDQYEELQSKHPKMLRKLSQLRVLLIGIVAGITGQTYDAVEASFRKSE